MDLRLGGDAAGPLAGLKVLDLSTVVSGPFCTQMLGDLGADVVKVESTRGDTTRMMGPPFKEGLTPIFSHFNRNKRSIALDLKQPGGQEVALRLACTADVLVENFRPGVARRLGLGSDGETADGYVVMMIIEDGQFHGICRALEREELIDDPRCANLITRIVHAEELFAMLEQEIRKWPTRELVDRARRFGAPVAPANDLEAFLADPQVEASGTVVELEDPKAGRMRFLGNPLRFERSPASFRRYPPRQGEHGDEVLRELGYGPAEVSELRAVGAVV